jgi:REP element-mobilizing transposase RayT
MPRPQRMYADMGMYFVTVKTFQDRMLLTPSKELNEVIGGVLAKAVSRSRVEVHGFVVMSNHLHVLVTAKGALLSRFMEYFLGNTARKVSKLIGWSGALWQRRFKSVPVLDDSAAEERLAYIVSHGVKEGLVRRPEDWPGLSCVEQLKKETSVAYRFFCWTRRWKKGQLRAGGGELWSDTWSESVTLTLSPIPSWREMTPLQRKRRIERLISGIVAKGKSQFKTVAGVATIFSRRQNHRPATQKSSPQPLCHAATSAAREAFRDHFRNWMSAFREASKRFRAGEWTVRFPPWAFRPGVLYQEGGT